MCHCKTNVFYSKSIVYIILKKYVYIINVVNIITQPMNVTVCLTQSTTATFTCVVEDRGGLLGIAAAGWHIRVGGVYVRIPQTGRDRHMTNAIFDGDIITDTLTVTNVSVDDNGAQYQCQPVDGVTSMSAIIKVLGMYITIHL